MVLGKLSPIMPLPVMLEAEDKKIYDQLEVPKTVVVKYGYMKKIAELPYSGEGGTPGCGSKMVVKTDRGTELGEMLTTTCPNSGCGSAVSRSQMLEYIQNSGGKNYPFSTEGKILRIATREDVKKQAELDGRKLEILQKTREAVGELELEMTPVEVEIMLGFERIIIHYTSENWVDFRELVKVLAKDLQTRVEMHQVSSRDEARLVADYEKCGQHCCCKQFLKILKPISMRSAKTQKATLDPHKISGRCGRLMCCLRYEDQTYNELRKKLPNRKSHVMTDDGTGIVINTQILTQLCLIRLDRTGKMQAFPLEEIRLLTKEEIKEVEAQNAEFRAAKERRMSGGPDGGRGKPRRGRDEQQARPNREEARTQTSGNDASVAEGDGQSESEGRGKRKRRRRDRRKKDKSQEVKSQDTQPEESGFNQDKPAEEMKVRSSDPVKEDEASGQGEEVDKSAFPTGPIPKGKKKSRLGRRRRRGGEGKPKADGAVSQSEAKVESTPAKPDTQESSPPQEGSNAASSTTPEASSDGEKPKRRRSRGRRKKRPSSRPGGRDERS